MWEQFGGGHVDEDDEVVHDNTDVVGPAQHQGGPQRL